MTDVALEYADLASLGNVWMPQYVRNPSPLSSSTLSEMRQNILKSIIVKVSAPPADPSWLMALIARINELRKLPPNWDTYGGVAVTEANARTALWFIEQVVDLAPGPWIAPLGGGGIQLDWNGDDVDIEVVIDGTQSSALIVRGDGEAEVGLAEAVTVVRELSDRLRPQGQFSS